MHAPQTSPPTEFVRVDRRPFSPLGLSGRYRERWPLVGESVVGDGGSATLESRDPACSDATSAGFADP